MKDMVNVISGEILEEEVEVPLKDLCCMCNITPEVIMEMINEGVVDHREEREKKHWVFRGYEIHRIQVAVRLKRDLRVNLPGAALVLDLLEELERLRSPR